MGSKAKFLLLVFLVMFVLLTAITLFNASKTDCLMLFMFTWGFLFCCMFVFFEKAVYVYFVDGKDATKTYETLNEAVDAIVKECGSEKKITVRKW